jgi:hypothetical protein
VNFILVTCTGTATAKNGDFNVLRCCRENDGPRDTSTGRRATAAKNGHLNAMQWCHKNCCRWDCWDHWTYAYAAENGYLNVLQWCRENGCPWDEDTCRAAAENGHSNVWQGCRQSGSPLLRTF